MTDEKPYAGFAWKDEQVVDLGQLVSALDGLESPEEAQRFLAAYREVNEHADANLGYATGYLPAARGAELRGWMQVRHPILGGGEPTAGHHPGALVLAGAIQSTDGTEAANLAVETGAADRAVELLEQAKHALQQANSLGLPWQFRIARFDRPAEITDLPLPMICDVDVQALGGPRL